MNFEITSQLLEILMPFTENANIIVNTKNDNYCNQDSDSDFVILDEKNDVGFEVMENEIIVYYFTDHCHFEDYTSELTDGEDDYIQSKRIFA